MPVGKAFVDFQNDVTTRDLMQAHQEGFESVEHLKRYTTLGMGTDQGKTSNINALRLMAGLRGIDTPAAGTTTFRPPFTPVSIGALAGRNIGQHFRPVRRSPLHEWHLDNGAVMIEAGPWLRPWYYRWAGEDPERAYVEEMRLVRSGVGLSDVSSLGKIDVQGPDAAEFLNRVYVNEFARLAVGKARYGVMLNEDATVLDDGTTARFADTRYFMTTTTAQAAEVMSRLEFLLQAVWTELDVQVLSLTDQWAGMAVAGPKARVALQLALPGHDFTDEALPYMGCREIEVDGVPLRILRLSFSGELAFELYVPADHGVALWQHLLASAAGLGIRPYGLESLASLRIEKGHVAGLELDHRNTLDDLGLGKMARTSKPFVGRELRERAELRAPQRWSLVGLECLEPASRLRGGAILFAAADRIEGHGRGYVTSVTWSTELNRFIALALYQGGLAHLGEEIVCAYPLKGENVRAQNRLPGLHRPGRGAPACLNSRSPLARQLTAGGRDGLDGRRALQRRRGARLGARPAGGISRARGASWQRRSGRLLGAEALAARPGCVQRSGRCHASTAPPRMPTGWSLADPEVISQLLGAVPVSAGTVTVLVAQSGAAARGRAGGASRAGRGISVDLHPRSFAVGAFAQTALHHTGVLLERCAPERYELYVLRTFALSIWEWLLDAALPVGYEIAVEHGLLAIEN